LPFLFWDNEKFVPASKYPNFQIFTDACLAQTLGVSKMRVQTWRTSNVIPSTMQGNFAVYNLNSVLESLKNAGYKQDLNKKSTK